MNCPALAPPRATADLVAPRAEKLPQGPARAVAKCGPGFAPTGRLPAARPLVFQLMRFPTFRRSLWPLLGLAACAG